MFSDGESLYDNIPMGYYQQGEQLNIHIIETHFYVFN